MAKKIGFDACGTTQDMPDPIANAIHAVLDHLHAQDARLEAFRGRALRAHGIEPPTED